MVGLIDSFSFQNIQSGDTQSFLLQECISGGNPSSDLRCGDGFDCVNDV